MGKSGKSTKKTKGKGKKKAAPPDAAPEAPPATEETVLPEAWRFPFWPRADEPVPDFTHLLEPDVAAKLALKKIEVAIDRLKTEIEILEIERDMIREAFGSE